jgi:hypothetical protein
MKVYFMFEDEGCGPDITLSVKLRKHVRPIIISNYHATTPSRIKTFIKLCHYKIIKDLDSI